MPIPPPMQRDATPLLPPVLWRACSKVTSTLQPDMPMGWPREMAPPLTFTWGEDKKDNAPLPWRDVWTCRMTAGINANLVCTLSTFRPSSLTTAIDWAANASLISNKSTWSSCQPAFSTYEKRNKARTTEQWTQGSIFSVIARFSSDFSPLSWWPVLVHFPW